MQRDPNCIFCKIIVDELPSHKVYEDEDIYAFLDIHPIHTGHTLVIPKTHEPNYWEVEKRIFARMMNVSQDIGNTLMKIFQPKRVGIVIAGFDVPHTHIHVVPMREHHDLTSIKALNNTLGNPTPEELKEIAQRIRNA